ncbi:Gfo/Idh/MocA family oxidoreductase [Saccharibacillus sp. CPCC 101409]|uniref:Gfo/Idh/MocA family protein n=1 Tax=Saccharibacillus sp. CPCC 101409 TaxID=3058041 RepID=UPI0026738352|nr:Gfo/Idh/MocA family oxidoreductase [Saccharibacillus sp. CPCC 101409]MDO3408601.1 Gfo/Idh/MocA family oxidoreductase [Saccharibacillus sp. CPCC 101409]
MAMESKQTYNLVIVGFGGMGSYHGQLIEQAERVTVFGTYDPIEYRMELARSRGFRTYESFEAVLGDEEVDIVLVATPNDVHKELSIAALRAGKHVICEKPVTMNAADLLEIVQAAEEAQRIFTVHQNRRWDEDFLIVKDLFEHRKVGDVFHLESRVQGANGIPGDWRQLKAYGGGMLLDWGVHLLDQLLLLTDSKIHSVSADLSYILGTEVDDGFIATIKFKDGLNAVIEVGTTNYIKLPRWYVKGTEGTAVIHDWDLSGEIVTRNLEVEHVEPKPIQAGKGLTKTMAPPSEESTIRRAIEPVEDLSDSFYANLVSTLEGASTQAVPNAEVHRVLTLIETIFEAADSQCVIVREI